MEKQNITSAMENPIMKMSTTESEQSLSDKCSSQLSNRPNSPLFGFDPISDEDINHKMYSDNSYLNYSQISDHEHLSDIQVNDAVDINLFSEDNDNHNISHERSKYFTLTYTNEDGEIQYTDNENMADRFSKDEILKSISDLSEGEENYAEKTMIFNSSDLMKKKSSMKLFSPEKVLDAMTRFQMADTEVEEKLSPMDISSPDSIISVEEDISETLGIVSVSEDSHTYCVDSVGVLVKAEADSLEEISSGEISSDSARSSSNISQDVSEYWDEERYLSEYYYDEQIDEDKTRKLLDFGDDYRNFIDSLSESQSSIFGTNLEGRKKTKRLSKRKSHETGRLYDTCSDNEMDDLSSVIADSQREINSVETRRCIWETDGFVKEEHFTEYKELMGICSGNLNILIDLLKTKDLHETFVSKKKSRDMRFLLNKWERLHNKIKENIQQTGIYTTLKKEVLSFRMDLTNVLERTEEQDESIEEGGHLENKLHTFKDAMMELSNFKSHLFELNLSVHNFLAELNSSHTNSNQVKFQTAVHLKDDVIELYTMWDRAHHQTAGSIASVEDALKKLKYFESELLELRNTLRQDAIIINEKGNRRKDKRTSTKNSSGDSGISDDSAGYFTDSDIPLREEHLTKLMMMAKSLEQSLPAGSTPMLMINHTLQSTSQELKDLQKSYKRIKALKTVMPKHRSNNTPKEKKIATVIGTKKRITSCQLRQRRKVIRMALLMNFLLFLTAILLWVCQPHSCDSYNSMAFSHQPQLRYVNGPPPT